MTDRRRVGLIVNPIAGIGGRVGLKGSDGPAILRAARERGGVSEANDRARVALETLKGHQPPVELVTAPGEMGEDAARAAGFSPRVVGMTTRGATTADDTRRIAEAMTQAGLDLLLFAGGDGTARDVLTAVGGAVPVIGIAAGVKVYSAAFAINARRAGELAGAFLHGRAAPREAEVLDLDEDAYRAGRASPGLHGYLRVPFREGLVQGGKAPSPASERMAMDAIADDVAERLAGRVCILGPGTTMRAVADRLGVPKTLAGVDVAGPAGLIVADAGEAQLLEIIDEGPVTIVVTPIGGQGFLFGRGNPQIGPRVLARVPRDHLLVVATPGKLAGLHGQPLLIDTGDAAVDASLAGYLPVMTGYHERVIYRVSS